MSRVYWKGGNAGVEGSWLEEGSLATVLKVAAAVDLGDNVVRIETNAAHAFIQDDYVVLNGTDNYDGNHRLLNVSDNTHLDIAAIYVAETFAVTDTAKSSNWQDEFGVPINKPAAADDVIFNSLAGVAVGFDSKHEAGKHWNCISDIAIGDIGGLELGSITVEKSFTGRIGIDNENTISPLHISIENGGSIIYRSDNKAYIECSASDAVSDINIPLLVFDTVSGYLQISSDMNSGAWTSTWDLIKIFSGGVLELATACVCTTIRMYNSYAKLIVNIGCVDVKGGDTPIDLYPGDSDIYGEVIYKSRIETDGLINFGTSALTFTRGR